MLIYHLYPLWGPMKFIWWQFQKRCHSHQSINQHKSYSSKISCKSPSSKWINHCFNYEHAHHSDVIMSAMASQITGVSIVFLTVCSGTDQRKHQSSISLAFVMGIQRWPVDSHHKGPVMQKRFPFENVIMDICPFTLLSRWTRFVRPDHSWQTALMGHHYFAICWQII